MVKTEEIKIEEFLSVNSGKPVIAVQGLGFVGAVMSLVCANALNEEYAVIGVDLPNDTSIKRIDALNSGKFPIESSDAKVFEYYENARKKGNFLATHSSSAYRHADVIIVDINLDVQKDSGKLKELKGFEVSLDGFKSAMRSIGSVCREDVLILVETTVPPGTSEFVLKPIILEELEKRGMEFKGAIGHSYERVMPGPNYVDSIQNFYRVYSGVDSNSANRVENFLKTIIRTDQYPLTRLSNTHATEMAKVLENSFRAMNIAFIQEWSNYAEEAGVNLYEVVNAIRMRPTHKNIMMPGLGVGGYCLTKDPLLASWSKKNLFHSNEALNSSEKAVQINDQMPLRAFDLMEKAFEDGFNGKKVLMLGVSYLNDVGDTRYTPVELLTKLIVEKGGQIKCHDPFVGYWEELNLQVERDFDLLLNSNWDAVILSTAHSEYKNNHLLMTYLTQNRNLFVLDCWGLLSEVELSQIAQVNRVKVIGRGDI